MHQKICWVLFISYLVVLTYFMFFSDGFGRSGHEEYAYNLILFKEIKRFYKYRAVSYTHLWMPISRGRPFQRHSVSMRR